jgi:hypothetical protein
MTRERGRERERDGSGEGIMEVARSSLHTHSGRTQSMGSGERQTKFCSYPPPPFGPQQGETTIDCGFSLCLVVRCRVSGRVLVGCRGKIAALSGFISM